MAMRTNSEFRRLFDRWQISCSVMTTVGRLIDWSPIKGFIKCDYSATKTKVTKQRSNFPLKITNLHELVYFTLSFILDPFYICFHELSFVFLIFSENVACWIWAATGDWLTDWSIDWSIDLFTDKISSWKFQRSGSPAFSSAIRWQHFNDFASAWMYPINSVIYTQYLTGCSSFLSSVPSLLSPQMRNRSIVPPNNPRYLDCRFLDENSN